MRPSRCVSLLLLRRCLRFGRCGAPLRVGFETELGDSRGVTLGALLELPKKDLEEALSSTKASEKGERPKGLTPLQKGGASEPPSRGPELHGLPLGVGVLKHRLGGRREKLKRSEVKSSGNAAGVHE
eukprot:3304285-Amphidinium_carterae.1